MIPRFCVGSFFTLDLECTPDSILEKRKRRTRSDETIETLIGGHTNMIARFTLCPKMTWNIYIVYILTRTARRDILY